MKPLEHEVVLASAGSGKTYSLVVRYISLLAAGVAPGSILATTFTRKAAAEILERLLARLADAAREPDEAARLAEEVGHMPLGCADFQVMLATVCRELPALQVSTLDSFFHRLVSVARWDIGLFQLQKVAALEEPAVRFVREEAIDRMLGDLAEQDFEELVHLVSRFYRGDAQRSVAWGMDRILVELYELYRTSPACETWSGPSTDLPELDDEELAGCLDTLRALAPTLGKAVGRSTAEAVALAQERQWEELLSKGVAGKVAAGEGTFSRQPLEGRHRAELERLVAHAQRSLLERLREQGIATRRVLERFEVAFGRGLAARGVTLFGDLAHALVHLLPRLDPERFLDLHFRLDGQIQHLLLDEFQDTSLLQWRALQTMAEEILAHGDGSHTMFCVGDPKQAIYGWRGGCPELFVAMERQLGTRERDAADEPVARSFRSTPPILDTVNRVFSRIADNPLLAGQRPVASQWQSAFVRHDSVFGGPGYVALRSTPAWEGELGAFDPWAEMLGVPVLEDELEERPQGHLEAAAAAVADLAQRLSGASIGVLVQTNRAVRDLLDRLRAGGLEASGEGGASIDDDPAVTAFLSALRLAEHPGDGAAWFHLRCGAVGSELGPDLGDGPVLVSRALRDELAALGLARALACWTRRVGAPTARSRRRLLQLVTLAEQFEADGSVRRIDDFIDWVGWAAVAEPEPARIRVMTVHKAKGLEFDAVVLCELDRALGALRNPQVNVLKDDPVHEPKAIFRATNRFVRSGSEELQEAHRQELARRLRDDLSALYVGMTRARSALLLLVQPLRRGARGPSRERLNGSGILRNALASEASPEDRARGGELLYEVGCLEDVAGALEAPHAAPVVPEPTAAAPVKAAGSAARSRRLRLVRPSALRSRARFARAHDLVQPSVRAERARGSFVHALLAEIAWLPESQTTAPWSKRAAKQAASRLRLHGAAARSYEEQLLTQLQTPEIGDIFRRTERSVEIWRERAFAVPVDRDLIRGVFDRVEIHRRRGRIEAARLIEFKTGGHEGESLGTSGSRDDFAPQVESYRSALSTMLGLLPTSIEALVVLVDRREVVRL